MRSQEIREQLRAAAVAAYGQQAVTHPAMETAVANLAAALERIELESLETGDPGPSRDG